MPDTLYIQAAISLPVYKTYTYQIPQHLCPYVSIGKRVLVPFGKQNTTGYIVSISQNKNLYKKIYTIKKILDILDDEPLFSPEILSFYEWISKYYIYPIGEVIKTALPSGINTYDLKVINVTDKGKKALNKESLTPLENKILSNIDSNDYPFKKLKKNSGNISHSLILSLEKKGYIETKRVIKEAKTKSKFEKYVKINQTNPSNINISEKQKKLVDFLEHQSEEISLKKLKESINASSSFIKNAQEKNFISVFEKKIYRDPFGESIPADKPPNLTSEQNKIVSTIKDHIHKGFKTFLLNGVTGSGKTEVYMRITSEFINLDFSVIVLVPEISLISQTEKRFRARFGPSIALLHSGLTNGERYDQWLKIVKGEAKIVIGARSAIFAPVKNLGIIIVDEEHDFSYKQDSSLLYNARDLSVVRAKLGNAITLLGSATPSIQSFYNAQTGKFSLLNLKQRINKKPLPEIEIVDLKKQKQSKGINKIITPELKNAIKKNLEQKKQTLIFLNRRGFANFPVCAGCGEPMKCTNCDVSLTYHKTTNAYICHFCGFSMASVSYCQECGSPSIKLLGFGTQKIEEMLKKIFPNAITARLDRDITSKKGALLSTLKSLKDGSVDILVGTQIIAKGHDFPNITLVGIICADISLNFPDFRSSELTFQLLAQVAGRAGRGDKPGKVILQTFNPEHFSIKTAKNQNFTEFYDTEIGFRKALNYPPLSKLIQIKISSKDKKNTESHAFFIAQICMKIKQEYLDFSKSIEILGPVESAISKIQNRYRWQILLKTSNINALHLFINKLAFDYSKQINKKDIKTIIDVDPFFML